MGYYPNELKATKEAANKSSVHFVRYDSQIYRSHNMLYRGAQRVKLPNLSNISRLLPPLAIFLRFQAFQRLMITAVVFWWKVVLIFGHLVATLYSDS